MNSIKIENFLNLEFDNMYRYITVNIDKNGKKTPVSDKKQMSKDEILKDKGNKSSFTHFSIALKRTNIICVDIDETNYDYSKLPTFFNSLPYTLGNTKGRHYFCKLSKRPEWQGSELKVFKDFEGDLLGIQESSNNVWEFKDKLVYNYTGNIPVIDFDSKIRPILIENAGIKVVKTKEIIKPRDIIESCNKDIIYKIIDGLNVNRATDFNSWMIAGYIFHNENYDKEVFDYFSKKGKIYSGPKNIKNFYSKLKTRSNDEAKLSICTMWDWLKEDNFELFKALRVEGLVNDKRLMIDVASDECFSTIKLLDYIEDDKKYLANNFFPNFIYSKSFKYFEHFYFYHDRICAIFKTDPEQNPILINALIKDIFPNAIIEEHRVNLKTKAASIKKHHFVSHWLTLPQRRSVSDFIFDPNPKYIQKLDVINLFKGYQYQNDNDFSYDINVIKPYIDHINYICGDIDVANYFLNWISWIIQKPHIKTTTAIIIYSETEGVGKNLIFDILKKLFGNYYIKLSNTSSLVDRFNSYQQGKLLAVCDEICAKTRDIANELKDIITRSEFKVEYKGKESFMLKDYCNYAFTTNNENVLRLGKTDRRLMVINAPEKALTKNKIIELVNILEDDNALKQLYNYFKTRDLTDFKPQALINTDYKKVLIANDLPAYFKMLKFDCGVFDSAQYTGKALFVKSLEYAKANNLSRAYTDNKCYMDLKKLLKKYYCHEGNRRYYQFPSNFSKKIDFIINDYVGIKNKHPEPESDDEEDDNDQIFNEDD